MAAPSAFLPRAGRQPGMQERRPPARGEEIPARCRSCGGLLVRTEDRDLSCFNCGSMVYLS